MLNKPNNLFNILFRGRTFGKNNVPKYGGVVVVANHGSNFDPPILGHALGRPIAFMAKAELFKIPFLSYVIRACGAYPVKRGASDREAFRTAINCLQKGCATGVFLDGTRQDNGRVNAPMAGAALLSARSGSPLLPVAIINSHRALAKQGWWIRFIPIHVRIGEALPPPESRKKADLKETTETLQFKINQMLDE